MNYFVHEKSRIDICFSAASFEVWWEFLTGATPIIITLMPMFVTSRAKMEHSILFVKIVNRYFERQRHLFRSFDGGSVRIEGEKILYLSVWENFCSHYHNKCLCLTSEKFVLASKSNLSLAPGLASWKVSLEPWVQHLNAKLYADYKLLNILSDFLSNKKKWHLIWGTTVTTAYTCTCYDCRKINHNVHY